MWQTQFRQVLRDQFVEIQRKNNKFSMRAFAKKLAISQSAISNLLSEKSEWNLSEDRAMALMERLEIDDKQRRRLLVAMGRPELDAPSVLPEFPKEFLTDWAYAAVFAAYELPTPLTETAELAKRLGVPTSKVASITADLLERGILVRKGDGGLTPSNAKVGTSDGIPCEDIQRCHADRLDLAKKALSEVAVEERDFTSLTFVGSRARLDLLRREIRKLYETTLVLEEPEANDSVFQLSIQLFPLEFGKPS